MTYSVGKGREVKGKGNDSKLNSQIMEANYACIKYGGL